MEINPLIPLQAQAADTGPAVNRLINAVGMIPNKTERAQTEADRISALGDQERTRIANTALIAEQVLPALQAGDINQVQSILQRAQNIDPEVSQQGLQLLQEDPEQLFEVGQRAIELNQRISGGQDQGKIGTFNPRDFTVESFSKFMETRDPRVLERFESQRQVDIGGVPHRFDPSTGGFFPAEMFGSGGQSRNQGRSVTAGDVAEKRATILESEEAAKVRGKSQAETQANFPKAQEAFSRLQDKWGFVDQKIDEALSEIGPLTTGFGGAALSKIPATQARDLKATLDTIRANIGFDELQQMRDASPTGGALGQVSEMENRLLQAVKGSLEQDQSPEQLSENLEDIKSMLQRVRARKEKAFRSDFQNKENTESGGLDLTEEESFLIEDTLRQFGGQ